jgi:hypothetical protein
MSRVYSFAEIDSNKSFSRLTGMALWVSTMQLLLLQLLNQLWHGVIEICYQPRISHLKNRRVCILIVVSD